MGQKIIWISQWTHHIIWTYIRRFCDVQGIIITCYLRYFKGVCSPGSRKIDEQKDLFLCTLHINKIYIYTRWKQQKYHTVTGCIYIYDMPVKDSKPKSKYPDEKKNR